VITSHPLSFIALDAPPQATAQIQHQHVAPTCFLPRSIRDPGTARSRRKSTSDTFCSTGTPGGRTGSTSRAWGPCVCEALFSVHRHRPALRAEAYILITIPGGAVGAGAVEMKIDGRSENPFLDPLHLVGAAAVDHLRSPRLRPDRPRRSMRAPRPRAR